MPGKLSNYSLGKAGVNVDKAQVFLDDADLTKSQNAIRDPLGVDGGLKNRPPLIKVNASAAGASVVGGIGVPLPIAGYVAGSVVSGITTSIYLGRSTDGTDSVGWYKTTDAFATTTNITSGTPGNPAATLDMIDRLFAQTFTWWTRPSCMLNGKLYYAATGYVVATVNTAAPPIRVFDGTTDAELCRIPGATTKGIVSMLAANGVIYLTTFDSGDQTLGTLIGRVFELTPDGNLTQLGPAFPAGALPYSLAYTYGRLWCGTNSGATVPTATTGKVYWFHPWIDTAWTLDNTFNANANVMALESFQGELYAAIVEGTVLNVGTVQKRTTLGVWSTVDSAPAGAGSGPMSGYTALKVFKSNLYAARMWGFGEGLKIRKFDGTSWTTAFSGGSSGNPSPIVGFMYEINGTLYTVAGGNYNNFRTTTDGTTWTLVTLSGSRIIQATGFFYA